jgi:hypothetical protein
LLCGEFLLLALLLYGCRLLERHSFFGSALLGELFFLLGND